MNFNIVISQYYPADSYIHKLDPRTKLLTTFVLTILLFFINNLIGYIILFSFLIFLIKMSNIPFKFLLKGLKSIFNIIFFTLILNMFFIRDGTIIFKFWKFYITTNGLLIATKMIARFVMLLISSSILTLTTTHTELTEGIESSLKVFKKIGIPYHEITMIITIALRFIPTILEEADKIIKAQKSRGSDFETGNIFKRIKNMIPVLIPLFISSFSRADDLALAMESRCYKSNINRTKLKKLKYKKLDYIFFLMLFLTCIISIYTIYMKKTLGMFLHIF